MKKIASCPKPQCQFCRSSMGSRTLAGVNQFQSILADITQQVGGERVTVSSLVGPNQDAHVYQPSPQDVKNCWQAAFLWSMV